MKPLDSSQLTNRIGLDQFNFETTEDLEGGSGFLGQPRAKEALEFGIGMRAAGYNLFVMGESGTGRQSLVSRYVRELAEKQSTANDIVYVNNFDKVREPTYLEMPVGNSEPFYKHIEEFIAELLDTFPAAFENPSYQRKRAAIDRAFNHKYDLAMAEVERQAGQYDVAVVSDEGTILLLPIVDGKALDDTEFAQISEELRYEFQQRINELEVFLNEQLVELPTWKRESSEQLRELNNETINQAIKPLIKSLEHRYQSQLAVMLYIRQIKKQIPKTIIELFSEESVLEPRSEGDRKQHLNSILLPNILVQHEGSQGVPVEYELLPTFQNLFGRIEYNTSQGVPYTNFQMIRSGSLHRANGGYLILDAEKLLTEPFAWDTLKLALKTKQIKMESPFVDPSMFNSVSLTPGQIPLQVKIILIGSRHLYYQLLDLDPEFSELFRVVVDFDSHIRKDDQNIGAFIQRIKHYAEEKGYSPLSKEAVALLIETSLRQAEHQQRFSAQIINIFKLIAEADYLRRHDEQNIIERKHIEMALKAANHRVSRIADQLQDEIEEGTILIDTDGERIGCVNGLTVMEIGDAQFGSPARISATVYAGSNGIVDIEREAELGQAIHSKGVLILTGYLGQKYGRSNPLALSANIAMEQSYGYVDGDSATVAELCALISAISQTPMSQKFAITGSMNQYGEVQAVGGINAKIEGFFRVCQSRGLKGQAVIIPNDNRKHLMLSDEVIAACDKGLFAVYTISKVEQAIELLTGKAFEKLEEGVIKSLRQMTQAYGQLGKS